MKSLILRYHWLFALILFCSISILCFGLHVILHLNTRFVGTGSDTINYIWLFAWYPHALLTHLNIFLPKTIFYPTGVNLPRLNPIPGLSFLCLPITLLFGPIVSYNICTIFSPGLAAWTAYLLCNHITKSKLSALVGGYFFGFSSYIIAQSLGHIVLVAPAILIPLFVLVILYKLEREISAFKFLVLFTLLLLLLFSISIEHFATLSFWGSISLFGAFYFFKQIKTGLVEVIKLAAFAYSLTACIALPFLYYFFQGGSASSSTPDATIVMTYSNDLLSFIIPSQLFLFTNQSCIKLSTLFLGNAAEWNSYVGIGLLLVFFIYIKQEWYKREAKYLTTMVIILAIASMGPALHIAGITLFHFPWGPLFTRTPLLDAALPSRLGFYMSLFISIIVSAWLKNSPWKLKYRFLLIAFAGLFLIPSFNQLRRPMTQSVYLPSFFSTGIYKHYLTAKDNIIFFPYFGGPSVLWQAETNFTFNLAGTYFGAPPAAYANDSIFSALANPTPKNTTLFNLATFLYLHKVTKFVMLDSQTYQNWLSARAFPMGINDMRDYSNWNTLVTQVTTFPTKTGGVIVYPIDNEKVKNVLFTCPNVIDMTSSLLNQGWSEPELQASGEYYRWTDAKSSSVNLLTSCRGLVNIRLTVIYTLSPPILNSLQMKIGRQSVPLHMTIKNKQYIFQGKANLIASNYKPLPIIFNISHTVPAPDGSRALGLFFNKIEVYP